MWGREGVYLEGQAHDTCPNERGSSVHKCLGLLHTPTRYDTQQLKFAR